MTGKSQLLSLFRDSEEDELFHDTFIDPNLSKSFELSPKKRISNPNDNPFKVSHTTNFNPIPLQTINKNALNSRSRAFSIESIDAVGEPLHVSEPRIASRQANERPKDKFKVSLTPAQRVEKHSRISNPSINALESYRFEELVGRGGCAKVYKAINKVNKQLVAIKQIEISSSTKVEFLMEEIDFLKKLKHDNIVKYHGYIMTESNLNIILEYCSHGSLRHLYKTKYKSGIPEPLVRNYIRETLNGLVYLHNKGVIHRDIKAANLLLDDRYRVKLADFGVSQQQQTNEEQQHNNGSNQSKRKPQIRADGSPYWMAPEIILLTGCSIKSDIWSLGATTLELLTTRPPYDDYEPMVACHAIGTQGCPELPLTLSLEANKFIEQCLVMNSEERPDASTLLENKWLHFEAKDKNLLIGTKSPFVESDSTEFEVDFIKDQQLNFDRIPPHTRIPQDSTLLYSKHRLLSYPETAETKTEDEKNEQMLKNKRLSKYKDNEDDAFDDYTEDIKLKTPTEADIDNPFVKIEYSDENKEKVKEKLEVQIKAIFKSLSLLSSSSISELFRLSTSLKELINEFPKLVIPMLNGSKLVTLLKLLNLKPNNQHLVQVNLDIISLILQHSGNDYESTCELRANLTMVGLSDTLVTLFEMNKNKISLRILEIVRQLFSEEHQQNLTIWRLFISSNGIKLLVYFLKIEINVNITFVRTAIDLIYKLLKVLKKEEHYIMKEMVMNLFKDQNLTYLLDLIMVAFVDEENEDIKDRRRIVSRIMYVLKQF
ncbi:BA75_03442T0 [Komagataella pastoris]|uniref:BA75_03442T0 n=1 Tax=Komagataella pastoris TaxID=4922 RepID=A0A1B2JGD3_PICPA|nr:BA75_03442T0 [Komagataella pastoris]